MLLGGMNEEMNSSSLVENVLLPGPLDVNPEFCLKLRHKKSDCRLCIENCPSGAISIGESVHIEDSLCVGCGICVNLCPTGTFELSNTSYEKLLHQVREGSDVKFSCSLLSKGQSFLQIPCIGYLNEAVMVAAVTFGAQSVTLNIGQCKKCDYIQGFRIGAKSLRRANQILSIFGISERVSATTGKIYFEYRANRSDLNSKKKL